MRLLIAMIILAFAPVLSWAACKGDKTHTAYPVNKMSCEACVAKITDYFSKLPAVANAKVSLEDKCMLLEMRPRGELTQAEVKTALEKLGFELGKVN